LTLTYDFDLDILNIPSQYSFSFYSRPYLLPYWCNNSIYSNRLLPNKTSRLSECTFLRVLFKDVYWNIYIIVIYFISLLSLYCNL